MSLLKRRIEEQKKAAQPALGVPEVLEESFVPTDPYQELKSHIHQRIVEAMNQEEGKILTSKNPDRKQLEEFVGQICNQVMEEQDIPIPRTDRNKIMDEMMDAVLGFGPIDPLLKDETIS